MKKSVQTTCGIVVDEQGVEWQMMSDCQKPVVAIEKLTPLERKEILYLCELHRNKRESSGNRTEPWPS